MAPKHPSMMDKRTKEYKDWAAAEAAAKVPPEVRATAPVLPEPQTATTASATTTVRVVEKKAPTRPWERKSGSRPWRRDYFNLEKKRPGFRARFVDPTKVEGRVQRGYAIANPEHYGGLVDIDIRESQGLGKYISRQGMVLMEIPEEGAQAYERQNEEFIQGQYKKMKKDVKEEANAAGFEVDIQEAGLK